MKDALCAARPPGVKKTVAISPRPASSATMARIRGIRRTARVYCTERKNAETCGATEGKRSHDVGKSFLILDHRDSLVVMRTNVKSGPAKPRPTSDEEKEQIRRALQTSMDTRQ